MRRLYRLQQWLSITGTEATAVLLLAGSLAVGLGVRQLQGHPVLPAADLFAEADAQWAALDSLADQASGALAERPGLAADVLPAETVTIPTTGYADAPARPRRSSANDPVRMNLNTADAALLQRLPRIGPALAGRILAYRQNVGPFRRVEEVVNVRGIGEKTLEKIAPYLYVE
ncbi:MAG: helix-hairpin-helix domain-containing protein [Rhodothermaceae bacterium]|nr:helix-hairpin-helix domain-containing protein [Rhodothermaceae bacterium]